MPNKYFIGAGVEGTFSGKHSVIEVSSLSNGDKLNVSVITIEGEQDGPTLGLIAAIHGAEQVGTDAIRRIITTLKPSQFRGRIIAVPVANPLAFDAKTRETPNDMGNLNRVFPGRVGASLTDRLAHELMEHFVKKCDYVIDYHSGAAFSTANYVLVDKDREMGLGFGCENVAIGPGSKGGLRGASEELGIPCITIELGGIDCGGREDFWVGKAVTGAHNLMKLWGMMDGKLELPPQQVLFSQKAILRPRFGGMYYITKEAKINAVVPKGTVLARIVNPATFEITEQLVAPFERNLILLLQDINCGFMAGDFAFFIANYDSGEIINN